MELLIRTWLLLLVSIMVANSAAIQIQDASMQADDLDLVSTTNLDQANQQQQQQHQHLPQLATQMTHHQQQQQKQQQQHQSQSSGYQECANKLGCRCRSAFVVDCSQLDLDSVPIDLQQDILSLNFTSNLLTDVQKAHFQRYTQLRTLRLKRNFIKRLGDGAFYDLHQLESLSLDSNRLTDITGKWLFGLASLQRLSINYNRIATINGSFWSFSPNISYLSLAHNKLKRVTQHYFQDLKSLLDLRLHHNNMTFIEPDSFVHLKHLINLDLSSNKLEVVLQSTSGIFNGLVSLERLDLQNNDMDTIRSDCFHPLANLRWLDMRNNPIRTLPQAAFLNLVKLAQFEMDSQRLNCDCDIEWLITVYNTSSTIGSQPLASNQIQSHPVDMWTMNNVQNNHHQNQHHSAYQDNRLLTKSNTRSIPYSFDGHGEAACASPNSLFMFKVKDLVGENRWRLRRPNCDTPGKPILLDDRPVNSSLFIKGQSSSLSCTASIPISDPPEQTIITWQKYVPGFGFRFINQTSTYGEFGRPLDPKDQTREIVETTMELDNIKESDSGAYQCVVSNRYGNAYSRTVNMTTYIYPYFTSMPRDTRGRADGSVEIVCGTAGHPSPSLSWSFFDKDNKRKRFPAASEKRLTFKQDGNGVQTLSLRRLSPEDEGTYSCVSTSPIGVAYANFTLTVTPYTKGPRQRSVDNGKMLSMPSTRQALALVRAGSVDAATWTVILCVLASASIILMGCCCLLVRFPRKRKPEPILTTV